MKDMMSCDFSYCKKEDVKVCKVHAKKKKNMQKNPPP